MLLMPWQQTFPIRLLKNGASDAILIRIMALVMPFCNA
jgi:hypothetical protein